MDARAAEQDRMGLSPRSALAPEGSRRIAVLAYEGVSALDVFGVLEPFSRAIEMFNNPGLLPPYEFWDEDQPQPYQLSVVSPAGGIVRTISGTQLVTEVQNDLDTGDSIDTLIVPGGTGMVAWSRQDGVLRWTRRLCLKARRVCALGGGVFVLAAARLLEGRRAVTRWDVSATLARDYPATRVEQDFAFVRDGAYWTAAGGVSAVDVGLALVEEDFGRGLAMKIARQMVVVARRAEDQPQLSTILRAQSIEDDVFDSLHLWIADNLGGDLRLEQLADRVGMSVRNFVRRYAEVVGKSPAKAVECMRVEAARLALESGDARLDAIAHRFGFSSEDVFRRVFIRHTGRSPRQYRAERRQGQCAA